MILKSTSKAAILDIDETAEHVNHVEKQHVFELVDNASRQVYGQRGHSCS